MKIDWTPIIILGAVGIGGYFLFQKAGQLIPTLPQLPSIDIPLSFTTGPHYTQAPTERIREVYTTLRETPVLDPFGISISINEILAEELYKRGEITELQYEKSKKSYIEAAPVYKVLKDAPPLDPFGISKIFKTESEKATRKVRELTIKTESQKKLFKKARQPFLTPSQRIAYLQAAIGR